MDGRKADSMTHSVTYDSKPLTVEELHRLFTELHQPRPRFIVTDQIPTDEIWRSDLMPEVLFIGEQAWNALTQLYPLETSKPELALMGIEVEFMLFKRGGGNGRRESHTGNTPG